MREFLLFVALRVRVIMTMLLSGCPYLENLQHDPPAIEKARFY